MTDLTAIIPGGQVPKGRVQVSGAKNAAVKLMAAALLTRDPVHLDNFPTELVDTRHKGRFLAQLGAQVAFDKERQTLDIHARELSAEADDYACPVRTTYLLAAGQLQRHGIARIPYPGGCKIGNRKYDLHIMVWERLGAKVRETDEYIEITCPQLRGAEVVFPFPTIGGTENALLCASVARGTTVIRNAYISPEVTDLIDCLTAMGADIACEGNSRITVTGKSRLRGTSYRLMPDRIEALTWIVYGILSGGEILIEPVPFDAMEVPLIHLREAGIDLFRNSQSVYISPSCMNAQQTIQPFEVATGTYPGVISDMQPFYVLLGLKADGISRIIDYRYPERTAYLQELEKLCPGAIAWDDRGQISVTGPAHFTGAAMRSTDLRGSMAVLLGSLLAEGTSLVHNVEMALRGYNNLQEKLHGLGVTMHLYAPEELRAAEPVAA